MPNDATDWEREILAATHTGRASRLKLDEQRPSIASRSTCGVFAGSLRLALHFFDLDDGLTLVGPAVQAGVMRQLEFVTLRAYGHTGRRNAQFLCPALVSSGSRMLMFGIGHRLSSSNRSPAAFRR